MVSSMRNSVQLVHWEGLKCRIVVSTLQSLPSLLQQTMFSRSSGPASKAPLMEDCQQQKYPVRSHLSGTIPNGKQREDMTIHPFARRIPPSGSRFFSSDSAVSSIPLSGRKVDTTFEALGDVDELNSVLGLAHEYCSQAQLKSTLEQIEEIQSRLLDIGSAVAATPLNSLSSKKVARVKFNAATMGVLDKWIERMDEELPHMSQFILPSGGLPAASLHVARSICRRAERKVVVLVDEQVVDQSVARYLNRLSDFLFSAARYTALKLEKPETIWRINNRR